MDKNTDTTHQESVVKSEFAVYAMVLIFGTLIISGAISALILQTDKPSDFSFWLYGFLTETVIEWVLPYATLSALIGWQGVQYYAKGRKLTAKRIDLLSTAVSVLSLLAFWLFS
jgi:hypothetical protein